MFSNALSLALASFADPHNTTTCDDGDNGGELHKLPMSVLAVVGITCVLSMIGALLIILSYVLIHDIRTKAREILVNLSVMDFVSAGANLIGIVIVQLDQPPHYVLHKKGTAEFNLCLAQASFAMYATLASVLWTICVAVYVFLRIMLENSKLAQRTSYAFYLICYGIPLIMTLWFALTGKLGYDGYGGSGWCSLIVYDGKRMHPFNVFMGNDVWIYLTIILVPLILISLHFYLRYQIKTEKANSTQNLSSAVQSVERKLILIPIFFILLRIWSLALGVLKAEDRVPLSCAAILFLLHMGGIGDSGQGFANAVLFVLFTPKVRRYFLRCCLCHRPKKQLLSKRRPVYYGGVPSGPHTEDEDGYTSATLSETSALNEQDVKGLLVNSS